MFTQYKYYFIIAVFVLYTFGVWQVFNWREGYKHQHETEVLADKAQQGQNNIIEKNQKLEKEYEKTKDPCLDAPVPDNIQRLLK